MINPIQNGDCGHSVRDRLNELLASAVQRSVTIADAAMLRAAHDTPIVLVESQGGGQLIVPIAFAARYAAGATAFAGGDNDDGIWIGETKLATTTVGATVLNSTTPSAYLFTGFAGSDSVAGLQSGELYWAPLGNWDRGLVTTITVIDGGTGYAEGDIGTLDPLNGAEYTVDSAGEDGVVLTLSITSNDIAQPGDCGTTPTTGAGSGLTVSVETGMGDGNITFTTSYVVVDIGGVG